MESEISGWMLTTQVKRGKPGNRREGEDEVPSPALTLERPHNLPHVRHSQADKRLKDATQAASASRTSEHLKEPCSKALPRLRLGRRRKRSVKLLGSLGLVSVVPTDRAVYHKVASRIGHLAVLPVQPAANIASSQQHSQTSCRFPY